MTSDDYDRLTHLGEATVRSFDPSFKVMQPSYHFVGMWVLQTQ